MIGFPSKEAPMTPDADGRRLPDAKVGSIKLTGPIIQHNHCELLSVFDPRGGNNGVSSERVY